jgi:antitoxin component YwqK of YwqJK toxin-antitoxin module
MGQLLNLDMETEIKREYWDNGKLMYEYSYVNGVQHVLQKWYYKNGQLRRQYHMKNGQWHEMDQNWYSDGRRYYVQQWKNGILNGQIIIFNYD